MLAHQDGCRPSMVAKNLRLCNTGEEEIKPAPRVRELQQPAHFNLRKRGRNHQAMPSLVPLDRGTPKGLFISVCYEMNTLLIRTAVFDGRGNRNAMEKPKC